MKPFKLVEGCRLLNFGSDVFRECVESLTTQVLVGRWKFESENKINMLDWLLKAWKKLLGYIPRVGKFQNGCFCFHFMKEGDVGEVMSRTWVLGRCFLALHRWDASFHLQMNAPINHLIWGNCMVFLSLFRTYLKP